MRRYLKYSRKSVISRRYWMRMIFWIMILMKVYHRYAHTLIAYGHSNR